MEKEAIVERALTRGVFLCHSSDKVSATGLTVNALFCHTSALLSLASPPLFPSPSCRLLCVRASCSASVVRLACAQSSLLSSSLHYSLKMGCHHHRRLCISVSSFSSPLWQRDRTPGVARRGGRRCHVACACFCVSCLVAVTIFSALSRPPPHKSCYQQRQKSPACERSKQIKQESPRGRKGGRRGTLLIKALGDSGGSGMVVVDVLSCFAKKLRGSGRLPPAEY